MIRLTCRQCKGAGTIPNPAYEMCRTMSPEAKRHFYFDYDEEPDEVPEGSNGCTVHEKTVPCPQCDGNGTLEFDEDEWALTIEPDEEEEG